MKHLLYTLVLALALVSRGLAQDFEGTIVWKMTAELDPAMKAQMDQAQAQLASPEMQAKLAQARAAMNKPEMQAMMQQNPAMRAMIEKQMGALTAPKPAMGGGAVGGMFPNRFVCQVKGLRAHIMIEGGMFPAETLALGDKDLVYQLDRAQRTYRKIPGGAAGAVGQAEPAFKVTPTGETAKILGYTCTRFLIEHSGVREDGSYVVWATKDIKGFDSKRLAAMRVGRERGPNFMTQIDGVPLKVEITTPRAKLTMQADAITAETLPAATFELPAGFTES